MLARYWLVMAWMGLPLSALSALDRAELNKIDRVVEEAIQQKKLPGAVVLVLHQGETVYHRAFGLRAVKPTAIPMTMDTLFDLASLTKPLATSLALMVLVDQQKLKITDPVARHWPEFAAKGKQQITIEHLLLHTGGLPPVLPLALFEEGKARTLELICQLEPRTAPGEKFAYSDIGFIVLGVLVEKISGTTLDRLVQQQVCAPLGLKETTFRPQGPLQKRAAPTEQRTSKWIQGEVHDPRAHLLDGVAGHAGLFSTSTEVAVLAQMLLEKGRGNGKVLLRAQTVSEFTRARKTPGGLRALGWDVDSALSKNRGSLFPRETSFGHTGFTGTSLWVDPATRTAVIFLSNRVHPDGKGDVINLRGQVATIAARAVGYGEAKKP